MELNAQDATATCPCFTYEEVESIFHRGQQQTADEGTSSCNAEDYSAECKAEVVVWNQNDDVISQASLNWYDYDTANCNYVDKAGNPGVERDVQWPHPAPEDTARACYDIIARVIAKSDTSGVCVTYP